MTDYEEGNLITNGTRYYKIQSITTDGYELVRTNASGTPIRNKNNKVNDEFIVESITQDMPGYEKVTSVGGKRRTHKRSKKARKSRKARRHH
jgi:hypothetical protein